MPEIELVLSAAIDELCDRFEDALRAGERPPLDEWLSAAGCDVRVLLPELVALDLHYRVATGESVSAADYFRAYPQLESDSDVAIRLVGVEYRAASSRNPSVSEVEFRRRYAALARLPVWSDSQWLADPLPETHLSPVTAAEVGHEVSTAKVEPVVFLAEFLATPGRPGDLGRLGEFHVRGILGAGAMGVVLAADDPALHRSVAIKLMRPEVGQAPEAKERFLREARSAAAIEHPRVVVIHSVGEWNGAPFLVMPLMRGRSLAARMKQRPVVPWREALQIVREAADGLAAAHTRGLFHRDIKPDNIWLEDTAEGTHVRLLDFGLARSDDSPALTHAGRIVGTPNYMSPEQAAGRKIDGRSDLFSLGCVLYELLTGRKAFGGSSVLAVLSALASRHPEAPRALDTSFPQQLSELAMRLLEKEASLRPASAESLSTELRQIERTFSGNDDFATAPPGRAGAPPREVRSVAPASQSMAQTADWRPAQRPARLPLWTWAAAGACLLAAIALIARSERSDQTPVSSDDPRDSGASPGVQTATAEPLWVKQLEVLHFVLDPEKDQHIPKRLGEESFNPLLDDQVQVNASLSKPAYAYLIAFRADGEIDVCFPPSEDAAPVLTDTPRYPLQGAVGYGLSEGTGLWAFVVVASEQPLPPYREWRTRHSDRLSAWSPVSEFVPGTVWRDDGQGHLDFLREEGKMIRQPRGKDEPLHGPHTSILSLTEALRTIDGVDVVSSVGFCVSQRE